MSLIHQWDKTFPKSDKVDHKKVTFINRYGITLVADLYAPESTDGRPIAAIAVSGPFGAVKEQSSGLYAQHLAERGYVTVAFDPSYTGESGGEPRNLASPEINSEDFSAAVDFLGLLPNVDRDRIGIVGICGFGGFGLTAAAVDKRIKAVVTTAMYDISRYMAKGLGDSLTKDQRTDFLTQLSAQRWEDAQNGSFAPGPRLLPESVDADTHPVVVEFSDYYRQPRGFHPNSLNSAGAWTATNPLSFMNFAQLSNIAEISPRPILLIAGEDAHSRYFTEDAYAAAAEPKELMILEGTNHVDLYDRFDKIPFDAIDNFFAKNL